MIFRNHFDSINKILRSTAKKVVLGDIDTIINTPPFDYQINQKGNKFALINCHIFDGIKPKIEKDMVILVEGDKILNVMKKRNFIFPDEFDILDLEGQTLLPGFIDNHVHVFSPFTYKLNIPAVRQSLKQVVLNIIQTIYSGVTTVCDMGGPQGFIKEFTELADKNIIPGPRFLNCFTLICPSKGKKLGYPNQVKTLNPFNAWLLEGQVATRPQTIEEFKKICYKVKDNGGTHLKTTYQPSPFSQKKPLSQEDFPIFKDDWMETIFKIGKEIGLVVDIHVPNGMAVEKCVDIAIKAGANIRIQHMTFDLELNDTLLQKIHDHGFHIIPTVMVYADSFYLHKFISWLDSNPKDYMMHEPNKQSRKRIQQAIELEPYSGKLIMDVDYVYLRKNFDNVKKNLLKAHNKGVIGLGTDIGGTNTGFFGRIFSEIEHYLDSGIPIFDTLKYLTSTNAQINGLNDRGTLQPGKLADIIGVDGNPLINPKVLSNVVTLMKGGCFLKYRNMELKPSWLV